MYINLILNVHKESERIARYLKSSDKLDVGTGLYDEEEEYVENSDTSAEEKLENRQRKNKSYGNI